MSGTASKGFSITISAVDAATKQIDSINRNLKAMQAPADRLTNSFSKLAQTSGITSLAHGLDSTAKSSFALFENLGRAIAPLGVLTGAASIAGLYRLVTGFAESGAELYRAGQRARISAGDLAAYEGAAKLAGSSSEAMGAGIKTLNDNMFHALQGTAPDAIVAFDKLGVAWKDSAGNLRNVSDVMPEVIQKLSEIKDPTYRAQIATMLLGGAAEDLAPVLRLTRKEFEAYVDAARQHGSLTDEQAKKALALDLAQRGLAAATQGLGNAISEQLAPVLTPMLIDLTNWLDANRGIIGSDIAGWVKTVIPEITEFAKQANALAQSLGGWKTILETVVAIKLGGWAVSAVTGLLPLLRVLALIPGSGVTAASLAAAGVGGVVEAVGAAAAATIALSGDTSLTPDQQAQLGTRNLGEFHEYLRANPGYRAPPPASGTEKAATAKLVHDQFRAAGYTEEQTAGVLASINRESGFDPGVLDPSGISKGLFQYTGDRRAKLERQYGQNPTAQQQVDFALKEIAPGGPEQAAGDRLRASRSANESGVNFRGGFERPANPAEPIATGQDAPKYVGLYDQGAPPANVTAAAPPANVTAAAPPANVAGGAGAAPAQPQPQTQTIKGSADLKIKISTDPGLSSKTTATTSGDVFSGAPRIEAAMAY